MMCFKVNSYYKQVFCTFSFYFSIKMRIYTLTFQTIPWLKNPDGVSSIQYFRHLRKYTHVLEFLQIPKTFNF